MDPKEKKDEPESELTAKGEPQRSQPEEPRKFSFEERAKYWREMDPKYLF